MHLLPAVTHSSPRQTHLNFPSIANWRDMTVLSAPVQCHNSSAMTVHAAAPFVNAHFLNLASHLGAPMELSGAMTPDSQKSNSSVPTSKPKIGFSIDSIVGTSSTQERSASPANGDRRESSASVSPRPSSGTPVSVRSEPESLASPELPQSPLFGAAGMNPVAAGGLWPPPGPAYFEALANMRALYGQPQQASPLLSHHGAPLPQMMANPQVAGPPMNHPWWLLAQARQQHQRLLAAAAAQRFPAGKFLRRFA